MTDNLHSIVRMLIKEALEFDDNKTFTPPHEVISAAQKALETVRPSSMNGDKGNGADKARRLAAGETMTFSQMKRLKSFFDTEEETKSQNHAAWELHGGDVTYAWVKRELDRIRDGNLRSKKTARTMGGAGVNMGMGTMDTNMMSATRTRERSAWSAVKNREQNAE